MDFDPARHRPFPVFRRSLVRSGKLREGNWAAHTQPPLPRQAARRENRPGVLGNVGLVERDPHG